MLKKDLEKQEIQYFHPPSWVKDDVWMFSGFSNVFALDTKAGPILIDSGLWAFGEQVRQGVRSWSKKPIQAMILTHGHLDHTAGLSAFRKAGDLPLRIIANENLLKRYDRYDLTNGWNAHVNQVQFGLPEPIFPKNLVRPTETFHDTLDLEIGGLKIELRAMQGETDDMCIAWLPDKKYMFCGDLFEWTMPNVGNPRKVERFPLEWAQALDYIAALEPEVLFPGHGFVLEGAANIQELLANTSALLRDLVDQVVSRLNNGEKPEEIYHAVVPNPEFIGKWYLRPFYDDPRFVIRNTIRKYGGWWNGVGSDLLPASFAQQSRAIVELAGGVDAVLQKGEALLQAGKLALAAHHADWAVSAEPENSEAQSLKRAVYEARLSEEKSMMAKGIYRHLANEARVFLGEKPLPSHSGLSV